MGYKVGDEVLIKAEITDVSGYECSERPYFVAPDIYSVNWVSEDKIIPMDKTYVDGLRDAWELAKKIYDSPYDGGLTNEAIEEIFGCKFGSVTRKYTAEEALAKIEVYEKEKEIKVENVVEDEEGTKALVIDEATENTCFVFTENGCVEEWYKRDLKNTGKKISIESLLRQIGE